MADGVDAQWSLEDYMNGLKVNYTPFAARDSLERVIDRIDSSNKGNIKTHFLVFKGGIHSKSYTVSDIEK